MAGSPLVGTLIQEAGGDHAVIGMVIGTDTIVVIVMVTDTDIAMVIPLVVEPGMLPVTGQEQDNLCKATFIEIELMESITQVSDLLIDQAIQEIDLLHGQQIHRQEPDLQLPSLVPEKITFIQIEMVTSIGETTMEAGNSEVTVNGIIPLEIDQHRDQHRT